MTTAATTSKTDELLKQLTEAVERLTSSEEWLRYLDVQQRFHRYSFGNVLLIALQRPDATQVAGFHPAASAISRAGARGWNTPWG